MVAGVVGRLAVVGVLAIATTAVAVGVAAPAHAVPGMVFVTTQSPTDSRLGKIQAARCPAGQRVLGGGGYIGGGGREVMIDSMRPVTTAAGDSFEVIASATTRADGTGFRGSWYVLAYAVCGVAPAGLEYVSASSASGLLPGRSVTASCPPGKRVIGAAGRVSPAFGFVALYEITPASDLTSVRVTAFETETPSPLPWRITAFAVCANPLAGLGLVSAVSSLDSHDKAADVVCPAGTRVHGLGARVHGVPGRTLPIALFPSQPLTSAHLRMREDRTGLGSLWRARVYAICAR